MTHPLLAPQRLYQELVRRDAKGDQVANILKSRLESGIDGVERLLGEVRIYHRHFTDHSISHSLRICSNIAEILDPTQLDPEGGITTLDIYLIIASALVHDIGMIVAEHEVESMLQEPDFDHFLRAHEIRSDREWLQRGVSRLHVAEYVRQRHARRSFEFVMDRAMPDHLFGAVPRLRHWVGSIAEAHGNDFDFIVSKFPNKVQIPVEGRLLANCNPVFVSLALRIGDLLDISTARACPLLRHMSEPLGKLSASHWDQYNGIEVQNLGPGEEICIAGVSPSQDAERVLREWVEWLRGEVSRAVTTLNRQPAAYRLRLGGIRYSVSPELINGVPKYEFGEFRFNLDERMVFERLFGKALYGRRDLALREIIQNAIDAQRAMVLYALTQRKDWCAMEAQGRSSLFREEIVRQSNAMPITIQVKKGNSTHNQRIMLAIKDGGVGMSRDTIQDYLLKVGRSRWSNDEDARMLGIGAVAIGCFGIGFISALMISDRVVVETKSCLPEETGIRATIYGWQGLVATEPHKQSEPGTTVTMQLTESALEDPVVLATTLARQLPLVDFPIIIITAESSVEVPKLRITSSSSRIVTSAGSGGSTLILTLDHRRNTDWAGDADIAASLSGEGYAVTLCQDGIAIGELRAPLGDVPEQQILVESRITLDLRGEDRTALDLSRNLVEGGSEEFWNRWVPRLWKSIWKSVSEHRLAGVLCCQLAERRYLRGTSSWQTVGDSSGQIEFGFGKLPSYGCLAMSCAQTTHDTLRTLASSANVWFLPDASSHQISNPEVGAEYEEDVVKRREMGDEGDDEDEDEDEDTVEVRRKWLKKHSKRASRISSLTTRINRGFRDCLSAFSYIVESPVPGVSLLTTTMSENGARLDEVLGFQFCASWYAIRNLHNHMWYSVPSEVVDDFISTTLDWEVSLGQVYLAVTAALFGAQYKGQQPRTGDVSLILAGLLGRVQRQEEGWMEELWVSLEDAHEGNDEDEDEYDGESRDDLHEKRRAARLRALLRRRTGKRVERDFDMMESLPLSKFLWLLTCIEDTKVERHVLPWEAAAWDKRERAPSGRGVVWRNGRLERRPS